MANELKLVCIVIKQFGFGSYIYGALMSICVGP